MAVVGRTSTIVENSNTTSITGVLPTDRQTGDLCLVFVGMNGTAAQFTGPGGSWTQVVAPLTNGSSEVFAAYYQFSPGSAPSVSTSGATGRASIICQSYGGVHPSTPFDVTALTAQVSATSVNAPDVSPVTANAMLVSVAMADTSPLTRAWVTPSGMTMVRQATVDGRSLGLAEELRASTGATGVRNWTHTPVTAGVSMTALSMVLRPGFAISPTGSVTATGVHAKVVTKNPFTASSTAIGVLVKVKVVVKLLTGAVTATGAFAKHADKVLTGSVIGVGAAVKITFKNPFTASSTATGFQRNAFVRVFTATLTAHATMVTTFLGRVFGRPGIVTTVARAAGEVIMRIRRT